MLSTDEINGTMSSFGCLLHSPELSQEMGIIYTLNTESDKTQQQQQQNQLHLTLSYENQIIFLTWVSGMAYWDMETQADK